MAPKFKKSSYAKAGIVFIPILDAALAEQHHCSFYVTERKPSLRIGKLPYIRQPGNLYMKYNMTGNLK